VVVVCFGFEIPNGNSTARNSSSEDISLTSSLNNIKL